MHVLVEILAWFLIALVVTPLLLLGLYAVASYFELKVADRILGLAARLLMLQWFSGGLLNVVGGLALAALGVWAVLHLDPLVHRLVCALLVPFGLWRAYRGAAVLREFSKTQDAP